MPKNPKTSPQYLYRIKHTDGRYFHTGSYGGYWSTKATYYSLYRLAEARVKSLLEDMKFHNGRAAGHQFQPGEGFATERVKVS